MIIYQNPVFNGMRLLALALVVVSLTATVAVAWEDCPYGLVNDPWPGLCRRYIDTNDDGVCDHSQPEPESTSVIIPPADGGEDGQNETFPVDAEEGAGDIQLAGTYHVIPIALALSLIYLVTYMMAKKDIIKLSDHRRLWNWALLATFLASAMLGLMLAICINFGWTVPFSTKTLFFHVELGISMAVISLFHILWHWNYWKGIGTSTPEKAAPRKQKRRN
jgi:hypothetical protein